MSDQLVVYCRQLDPILPAAASLAASPKAQSTDTAGTGAGVPALPASSLGLDASGEEAAGPYQRKLSKHEKQLMQQAHERHQANITTKQVPFCALVSNTTDMMLVQDTWVMLNPHHLCNVGLRDTRPHCDC